MARTRPIKWVTMAQVDSWVKRQVGTKRNNFQAPPATSSASQILYCQGGPVDAETDDDSDYEEQEAKFTTEGSRGGETERIMGPTMKQRKRMMDLTGT